ncbi:hypothetical protein [uncultured Pseudomonas sp.]|uniref:hypothetical protein n=1 Tax=uncultured Pseudomonas sp. TaxID=114707 RepID=UPI0025FC7275|nr:hypothetical protein [uncultured Pseudomonas sp.]
MGVLADFFVASEADALRYAARIEKLDGGEEIEALLKPVQYKSFTDLEISTLWAILEEQEWDDERHMPEDIFLGDDGESWLYRFPNELTEVLAHANEVAVSKASVLWSATEELSCEPEDLVPVLNDLQSLAKQAMESGKSLYLWGCL